MHRALRLAAPLLVVVLAVPAGPAVAGTRAAVVPVPQIVPFEAWAPHTCPIPTGADVSPTRRVVLHHSHHPTAATRDHVLPALAEMCDLHTQRGFDTVGYHYVVDPWGVIYQARGGLPDAQGNAPTAQPEGAHVAGANPGATGVVLLGDHEAVPPTDEALDAVVWLLAWLAAASGLDPADQVTIETTGNGTSLQAGTVTVHALDGHHATNATRCPGQHLRELLAPIRDRVRERVLDAGGVLRAMDTIRPAPDERTRMLGRSPIVAAPPLDIPVLPIDVDPDRRGGTVRLVPVGVLVLALVLTRRRRAGTA